MVAVEKEEEEEEEERRMPNAIRKFYEEIKGHSGWACMQHVFDWFFESAGQNHSLDVCCHYDLFLYFSDRVIKYLLLNKKKVYTHANWRKKMLKIYLNRALLFFLFLFLLLFFLILLLLLGLFGRLIFIFNFWTSSLDTSRLFSFFNFFIHV